MENKNDDPKEVKLSEGLESIGAYAFQNAMITKIELPSTVKTIGWGAFSFCDKLTEVKLNEGLESIGGYAFYWTAVEKIELPSTVKTIGQYAFSSCEKLAEVKLNEGLERIGGGAFSGTALQKVVVPFSLEEIDRTEDSEGEYIASERVFPENCELVWPDGRKIEIDEHNRNLVVHDYAKEKEYFEKKLESLKAIEGVDVGVQIAECEKGIERAKKGLEKEKAEPIENAADKPE
jgi:hypothetical protein